MRLSNLLASAVIATASVLAVNANAGVINTYQFVDNGTAWTNYGTNTGTPGTGTGVNLGASEVFTGSNGLQVTTTFFEDVNKSNGSGGTAVNGYWGHGLAVAGADGSASRVDNDGEAILFDFGTEVTALSSFFYGWRACCSTDVRVFAWDSGAWDEIIATAFSGYLTLNLQGVVSDKFLFVNIDVFSGNDTWALKGFAVETISGDTTKVPEPGTLALLGLGLAGLGMSRRRQKKASH